MHDWIPMKFKFDYKHTVPDMWSHYYCEATSDRRDYFKVRHSDGGDFFMDNYSLSALLGAMEFGSLIDGLTIQELQAAASANEEDIVTDISDFI